MHLQSTVATSLLLTQALAYQNSYGQVYARDLVAGYPSVYARDVDYAYLRRRSFLSGLKSLTKSKPSSSSSSSALGGLKSSKPLGSSGPPKVPAKPDHLKAPKVSSSSSSSSSTEKKSKWSSAGNFLNKAAPVGALVPGAVSAAASWKSMEAAQQSADAATKNANTAANAAQAQGYQDASGNFAAPKRRALIDAMIERRWAEIEDREAEAEADYEFELDTREADALAEADPDVWADDFELDW